MLSSLMIKLKDIYKRLTFQSEASIMIITVKRALPGDYGPLLKSIGCSLCIAMRLGEPIDWPFRERNRAYGTN